MNLGFKVRVVFNKWTETFRNITEIHYGYETHSSKKRIAFESDIHSMGYTYYFDEVTEFEALLEVEKADHI